MHKLNEGKSAVITQLINKDKKYMTESKTFPEIWKSLDERLQGDLRAAVIAATHVSTTAFWKWANGKSRPGSFPMEHLVLQAVNDTLGTSFTRQQLFP